MDCSVIFVSLSCPLFIGQGLDGLWYYGANKKYLKFTYIYIYIELENKNKWNKEIGSFIPSCNWTTYDGRKRKRPTCCYPFPYPYFIFICSSRIRISYCNACVIFEKKSPSQQYRKQNVKVYTYVPFENKLTSSCVLHLICCTSPIFVCFLFFFISPNLTSFLLTSSPPSFSRIYESAQMCQHMGVRFVLTTFFHFSCPRTRKQRRKTKKDA